MIIDGHLDLAFGALFYGRDLEHQSPHEIRLLEPNNEHGLCTTTLPALRQANVAVAFATLFATPAVQWTRPNVIDPRGYQTPDEAHAQGIAQIQIYENWAKHGAVRIIQSQTDLTHHLELWQSDKITGLIILMEGADPIRVPSELEYWYGRGVRIIGTSWGRTRYAGGTEMPGGLTDIGRELIAGIESKNMILDASHQSWEAFWDSLDVGITRLIASHSNAFALRATSNRHLTDAMLEQIAARDGRVGVVLLNAFLDPRWTRDNRSIKVTFENQVKAHLTHMASIVGWQRMGIGSDSDGGFGAEEAPDGFDTISDLEKIGGVVPPEHQTGVMGGNWLSYLQKNLPK
jgi:membrane dipeptidase